MWINRAEYETLKSTAKNNKHDANMFRNIINYVKENKIAMYEDFVFVNYEMWSELTSKFSSLHIS